MRILTLCVLFWVVFYDASLAAKSQVNRIVSLSPFLTEILFHIQAGNQVVGVTNNCDYPAKVEDIQKVAGVAGLDLERIIALQPDLIVAWESGGFKQELAHLEALGFRIYITEPASLSEVADVMRQLGLMTGKETEAEQQAQAFNETILQMTSHYVGRPKVSVMVEVWHRPIFTIGKGHFMTDMIQRCGGDNIFADLTTLAPQVSLEAVLVRDPEVLITHDPDAWLNYHQLSAVAHQQVYKVNPDWLHRPGPRLLKGLTELCRIFDGAR